jgi:hypothetical protein
MSDASASQRLLELLLAPGGPLDPERANAGAGLEDRAASEAHALHGDWRG